jgi:DNA-binding phage protein
VWGMEIDSEDLEKFFEFMAGHLDEKQRRLVAGGIARLLGRGGLTAVAGAAGMSRNTVIDGAKAYDTGEGPTGRVRGGTASMSFGRASKGRLDRRRASCSQCKEQPGATAVDGKPGRE